MALSWPVFPFTVWHPLLLQPNLDRKKFTGALICFYCETSEVGINNCQTHQRMSLRLDWYSIIYILAAKVQSRNPSTKRSLASAYGVLDRSPSAGGFLGARSLATLLSNLSPVGPLGFSFFSLLSLPFPLMDLASFVAATKRRCAWGLTGVCLPRQRWTISEGMEPARASLMSNSNWSWVFGELVWFHVQFKSNEYKLVEFFQSIVLPMVHPSTKVSSTSKRFHLFSHVTKPTYMERQVAGWSPMRTLESWAKLAGGSRHQSLVLGNSRYG